MDEADRAEIEEARTRERALMAARDLAHVRDASFTGRCLWCGEPVEAPRRWCDAGCRDDWERHHARRHARR